MKFSIIKGDIEEFAILEEKLPENLDGLLVDNKISVKLNVSDKRLALLNTVRYIINDKNLLKITSALYFQIEEDSWKEFINDQEIKISKEHLHQMGIITTGATRGMLIAKCLNTSYSKLILPPINVSKMINHDLVFELENDTNR